jgi:hypothetical protein
LFKEFLWNLISKLQESVQSGNIMWKSTLRDFSLPCQIEIFASSYSSLMFVFPKLLPEKEQNDIRIHLLPDDREQAVKCIQDWVDDEIWTNLPYPQNLRDPTHPNLTFRHILAALSPTVIKLLSNDEISEQSSITEGLNFKKILGGALFFLDTVPDLEEEVWSKELVMPKTAERTTREEPNHAIHHTFGSKIYAIPSLTSDNTRYGCYFSPCVWMGDDFWLDVKAHISFPVFRDIAQSFAFVGKSIFLDHTIYFDAQGMLIVGSKVSKQEAKLILNKLMFSLGVLVDKDDMRDMNRSQIYPVSENDLCELILFAEPSSTLDYPSVSIILSKGTGNREYWLKQSREEVKPLETNDQWITLLKPQKFKQLIELASEAYTDLISRFPIDNEMFVIIIRCFYQIHEKNYLTGFILTFFALERVIHNVWKRRIEKNFISKGMSSGKLDKIRKMNWTLALKTQILILTNVLSNNEGTMLDNLRKIRNDIAHPPRRLGSHYEFNREQIESFFEFFMMLLQRVDLQGNIHYDKKDDEIIERLSSRWGIEISTSITIDDNLNLQ